MHQYVGERYQELRFGSAVELLSKLSGKRLMLRLAADGAGQKGAHVGPKPVTRLDASRYVTGAYLLLGDLLRTQSGNA